MALSQLGGTNLTYLSVSDGNLTRQHKQANDRTTERVTKTGKLVFEERFKDLTGIITNVNTRENDYGKQWQLTFEDGSDTYIVSMPYSSRYASSFLKALPNIDIAQPLRFMPWAMKDKNDVSKTVTGITMYQNDTKIAPAFTREEPNGLPQMEKIKVKGKEQWDDSAMMEFLEQMALKVFAEHNDNDILLDVEDTEDIPF
jgi:hypothetical protein